ncbi:hypothetical protein THAOC_01237, partial [Thalassiosira oceanica]
CIFLLGSPKPVASRPHQTVEGSKYEEDIDPVERHMFGHGGVQSGACGWPQP